MAYILKTYDPARVAIAFKAAGDTESTDISAGLAPDTFLNISPDAPNYTHRLGIGRRVARMKNSNKMSTVTITLMQNSDANKELMFLMYEDYADALEPNGDIGTMTITDDSNTILVELQQCYITGLPEFSLGKTYGTVTWTFRAIETVPLNVPNDGAGGISGFVAGLF